MTDSLLKKAGSINSKLRSTANLRSRSSVRGRNVMHKVLITAAIVLSCISLNIHAQTVAQQPAASPKINLTLEQRYIIKEIVKDMKVDPIPAKDLAVGDQIPDNIRLQPMPSEIAQKAPQIKAHRFFGAIPDEKNHVFRFTLAGLV